MRIADLIRERAPLTVAAFMDLALYDPEVGYYARAAQRSGRAGDFLTSVDVGPLFGELLEIQLAEMAAILRGGHIGPPLHPDPVGADRRVGPFDFVEAGAGNGRLSADILRAARRRDPGFYDTIKLHLVEASAPARDAQADTLGDVRDRLVSSIATVPDSFEGALIANELLDALPVHQVVMREDGLREVYVVPSPKSQVSSQQRPQSQVPGRLGTSDSLSRLGTGDLGLGTAEGPLSTPALQLYLDRAGVRLQSGWRVEINLRAVEWVRDAARRLRRGFIILIDYGHDAHDLYSETHALGTLTTYTGHRSSGPESTPGTPAWLSNPGEQDLTAHVDFTSVRDTAEAAGMTTIGFLDQTYFVLGLLGDALAEFSHRSGPLKTLLMPGGLGSTHKVLILGKGVGRPSLKGCSFKVRMT